MTALDAILDGFESALELERELGNRIVPCDRKLLAPLEEASQVLASPPLAGAGAKTPSSRILGNLEALEAPPPAKPRTTNHEPRATPPEPRTANHESRDILFVHHRPFTERAQALMDNIIKAMKLGEGQYQVVFGGGPLPPAKVCVVLGSNALVQIMPGGACQPGSWTKTPSGADALVTYSPEFILRFSEGSEGQKECQRKMWASLKSALSRAGLLTPTTGKTP